MNLPIGQNIKTLRQKSGWTQRTLAYELQVSIQAVSKWEQERSYPDVTLLPRIAKLFSVSIDSLFGTSNNRMSNN
jgi:transcriptional regulator with XRE-family HTH domain